MCESDPSCRLILVQHALRIEARRYPKLKFSSEAPNDIVPYRL